MQNLGKKIVVVGVSASGKSTFARLLADKLKIEVTFMDEVMWRAEWNYVGDAAVTTKLDEIRKRPEWIIEGYLPKFVRTMIFEKADTIIYLDHPSWVSAWRYLKRYWKHRKVPRPELNGSPDKFSFKFLKLIWTKREAVSLEKYLEQITDKNKVIRFTSPKETELFLSRLS